MSITEVTMPLWSCLLSCLLASAMCASESDDAKPDRPVAEFLGATAVRVIAGATRVEAFRVSGLPMKNEAPPAVDGYRITAVAGERADAAAILRSCLFDAATYSFDSAKGCEFMPGVAFRIWMAQEHIDVLICFSCDEVRVITYDRSGAIVKRSHEDCDHARPRLLALTKAAFPQDELIQALK